ncbi:MAG: response regulator [Desulfobacterales bacterium]|nr:response regulator [Desulfobacterales bacterium]
MKSGLHILIADDMAENARLIAARLKQHGHTSVMVPNGREAVALANENHFDLIFMDVQMPGMNGLKATRTIREGGTKKSGRFTPIVGLTACVGPSERMKCHRAGMDDVVEKPIDFHQLFQVIAKHTPSRGQGPTHQGSCPVEHTLHQVSDLDTNSALSTWGDASLLLSSIRRFATRFRATPGLMKSHLELKEFSRLKRKIHAMKGVAGNLSLTPIYTLCLQIDESLNQKTEDALLPLIEKLEAQLDRLNQELPIQPHTSPATKPHDPTGVPMQDRPKIVAIDDELGNLEILRQILKKEYDLTFATSGQEGITAVQRHKPDLILLDVVMPEMSGHDICRALKADLRSRAIPIIFVTAMGDESNEALGFELGAADYITKPFNTAVLKARIATHLALYAQNRALDTLVRKRTDELNNTRLEIIQRLGRASEYKDDETGLHIIRMSHYTRILAEAMGFGPAEVNRIFHAAPMHDIGKIGIPDHILLKPTALSEEEWKIMKRHPEIGAEILGDNPSPLFQTARSIAMTHHERWNGKGYPFGLSKEEIPIEGRIVALADVFDALTSQRPYKKAWPLAQALEYIQSQAGHLLDPQIVPLFMENLDAITRIMKQFSDPHRELDKTSEDQIYKTISFHKEKTTNTSESPPDTE